MIHVNNICTNLDNSFVCINEIVNDLVEKLTNMGSKFRGTKSTIHKINKIRSGLTMSVRSLKERNLFVTKVL